MQVRNCMCSYDTSIHHMTLCTIDRLEMEYPIICYEHQVTKYDTIIVPFFQVHVFIVGDKMR